MTQDQVQEIVTEILNRMVSAYDTDIELQAKGEPAIEKLKLVSEMQSVCIRRELQKELFNQGLLRNLTLMINN